MKMIMIAALSAAQLSAAASPARAGELPGGASMERVDPADGRSRTGIGEGLELSVGDGQAQAFRAADAQESSRASAAREDEPRKKRKSTGDKVLTGAAVVLGIGALAVGGLLVAIFVN